MAIAFADCSCASHAQVVLVALPGVDIATVEAEVSKQCDALPRGDVARQALAHSCIVIARDQVRSLDMHLRTAGLDAFLQL